MSNDERTWPALPGAVGVSDLLAYTWQDPQRDSAAEDERGGTPHVHLACAECYLVLAGRGRLRTLTVADGVGETPMVPGDMVWFTPGTVHRVINDDGALRVLVIMQNGGLPEAGDAILTLPPEQLVDEPTYQSAVAIAGPDGQPDEALIRARRDRAVAGFERLCQSWESGDPQPLEDFLASAAQLVDPRLHRWRQLLVAGALAQARKTWMILDALGEGTTDHLRQATVARAEAPGEPEPGMCGWLRPYHRLGRNSASGESLDVAPEG